MTRWKPELRRLKRCAAGIVFILIVALTTVRAENNSLWDLSRLRKAPKTEVADDYGAHGVHAVFYEGEPWKGKRTKVYAYYGLPKGASKSAPVPGVVCVHGGSGTAFATWVQIWNKQGFAAIAMDTNGAVP